MPPMAESMPYWTARVLTLFPDMFPGTLGFSLSGTALKKGIWELETLDIRNFARNKHRNVDGAPFGGGPGMVMRPDVVGAALESVGPKTQPVYLTPRGSPLTQEKVRAFVSQGEVTILCGRFEGVDERVLEAYDLDQVCIGDFVLSGGEPAAMVLIDACVRLLPDVVGNETSVWNESFEEGLLEYPQYTRPEIWDGRAVPAPLVSGHHERIREWRRKAAENATRERRPDLWALRNERNMAVKD